MNPNWIAESRLWLVLDRRAAAPRTLPEVTEMAVRGGVDAVLCRIKDAPDDTVAVMAGEVRDVCRRAGLPFVMSHFPELAAELQADAVQLGIGDPEIGRIKETVGNEMAVGYSTHSVAEALARFQSGADYVFLGPVFATPEKLKYGSPLGTGVVRDSLGLPGPVVYIGGIAAHNVEEITASGGKRIAAISAMQRCDDPEAATRVLRTLLSSDER